MEKPPRLKCKAVGDAAIKIMQMPKYEGLPKIIAWVTVWC
jgi:hypothetical protein